MNYKIQKTEDFELINHPSALWNEAEYLELKDVTSGAEISKKAKAKMLWSENYLYVLFDVEDDHIWGTYQNNDDPIYDEEVVEVFITLGEDDPKNYLELQFSPFGVKFDAKVKNPTGSRHDEGFEVDKSWDSNLEFVQSIIETDHHDEYKIGRWLTQVKIPAKEIGQRGFISGDKLRGNLFRIDGYPKQNSYQALVPNLESVPNFHTPKKFATFELT